MNRLAGWVFALLVLATAGAFFIAQELKSTPPVVQQLQIKPFFSPNGDGRFDRARASFVLKKGDDVTATVVDADGDAVRRLVDDRELAARRRLRLVWDGRDDDGRTVADGKYRIELGLRRQGRTVQLPRNILKDTAPPRLRVLSIGPERDKVPRPELLPRTDGRSARVTFQAPGRRKEVIVYRTDVVPARSVFDRPLRLRDDATRWEWDGTGEGGRRVAAGTYVVVLRARDQAGNVGTSVPLPVRLRFQEPFAGRGGITVRYLTAQAPTNPVVAGQRMGIPVDSVGERFTWTVRRVGDPRIRKRGRGTRSRIVHFGAPNGKSGLYLFEVRTRTRRTAAPFVVQAEEPSPVLVVVPFTSWQGRNPRDDDGDGRVDTLGAGLPVDLARPFVRDGVPPQVRRHEALLLSALDRQGRRYDITTDVALARRGVGAQIAGHEGVIVAGDARWLDGAVGRSLRSFARGGGRVLSVGTGSLRRSVRITPGGRAIDATPPTVRDLFGARLRPIVRGGPVTLTNTVDDIDLFAGTAGQFTGFRAFEETVDPGPRAQVRAAASTQDGQRDVIVAIAVGDGLVVRTGLPDFSLRLREDLELDRFLARVWTELRR